MKGEEEDKEGEGKLRLVGKEEENVKGREGVGIETTGDIFLFSHSFSLLPPFPFPFNHYSVFLQLSSFSYSPACE